MKSAVLGSPISHSLSPVLHRAGFAARGLTDWSYASFELKEAELPEFLGGLDAEWRGLSLTMPLKIAAVQLAEQVTPLAHRAGVANTLVRLPDGGWLADNTDIPGLVDTLRPSWDESWTSAVILGAGATARSALLALAELGIEEVICHARNLIRIERFVDWARRSVPEIEVGMRPLPALAHTPFPVVISTLPAGVADQLSLPATEHGLFFDVVYAGWPTALAVAADQAGWDVVSGLDLLVNQAARQFEQFTGQPAPLAEMFAAGRAALDAS